MKHVKVATCLLFAGFSSISNAQLAKEEGVTGEFSMLAGMSSTNSNLSTSGDEYLPNGAQKRTEELIGGALGNLTYTFGEDLNKQVFIGTSREDIATGLIALEMGYRYLTDSGTKVSLAFLPTVLSEEVWKDPYNFDAARETTDRTGNAYLFSLSNINGSAYSVDIGIANIKVDEELSGVTQDTQQLMNRDGNSYFGKLSYQGMLTPTSGYSVSLRYLHHDTKGDAMAYDHLGAEGTWFKLHQRHKFAATLTTGSSKYKAPNPIFEDEKRSDTHYTAFGAYEYANLFGFEDFSFVSLASYTHHTSNIDFYDYDEYFFSAGFSVFF
ncbi:DUF2860 family protein [Grimontia sp. S25]|uniref:DUF2860 family protein n=1 Tax=Grimontia sedimenti TaxID=2711294 RepID=A0A6M1RP47_9GAMM|nr:DUF2860 family protein [Grimontia sedimenti]NGN99718.1 DUF2860 family protein [Grimontia sedimenti]